MNATSLIVRGPELLPWEELVKRAEQKMEWLLQDLIPLGAVTILAGDPNAGKTRLVNAVVSARSSSCKLAGLAVREGTTLILSLEHGLRAVANGLREAACGFDLLAPKVHVVRPPFDLLESEHSALLDGWLEKTGADLLVVDSMRRVAGFNENDSQEVAPILEHFRRIADEGVTVVLIHHLTKSVPGKSSGGLRGSGDLKAGTDSVVTLRRVGDLVTIHAEHHEAEEEWKTIRFVHREGAFKVEEAESATPLAAVQLSQAILGLIGSSEQPQTATAVRNALRARGVEGSNDDIRVALDGLLQAGQIEDRTPGKKKRSYVLASTRSVSP